MTTISIDDFRTIDLRVAFHRRGRPHRRAEPDRRPGQAAAPDHPALNPCALDRSRRSPRYRGVRPGADVRRTARVSPVTFPARRSSWWGTNRRSGRKMEVYDVRN